MTSFASSPFTMPAALAAADTFLGGTPQWTGDLANVDQVEWLESFRRRAAVAARVLHDKIQTNATTDITDHGTFLQKHGWPAKITQGRPNSLYLAAVARFGGRWLSAGDELDRGGHRYAHLRQNIAVSSRVGPTQLVGIETEKSNVQFLLRQALPDEVKTQHDLRQIALFMQAEWTSSDLEGYTEAGEVEFPMIDLTASDEAAHMIGIASGDNVIYQAAEQFTLQMNHLGGLARAAAELAMARGGPSRRKPRVVIEGPFVTAVIVEGVHEPVYAAYCDRDSWKVPDLKL